MKIDKSGMWKNHYLGFYLYIGLNGFLIAIDLGDFSFDFDVMFTKTTSWRDA